MDLLSAGNLCQIMQRSPQRIVRELEAAGISPHLILNGIKYFPSEQAIQTLTQNPAKTRPDLQANSQ